MAISWLSQWPSHLFHKVKMYQLKNRYAWRKKNNNRMQTMLQNTFIVLRGKDKEKENKLHVKFNLM